MIKSHRHLSPFGHLSTLAAALFIAPLAASSYAQQGESFGIPALPAQMPFQISQPKALNLDLQAALHAPSNLSQPGESSSSSSSSDTGALSADALNLAADPVADGNLQPPPRRRRYGQPNYNDRFHNSDGSNRLAFVAGVGFNIPVGSASSNYLDTNFRFEVGGGVNLSKKLGVLLQFDYDRFGVPGSILTNQENLYGKLDPTDAATGAFQGLDGNSHIWSFTLNPTFNFYQGEKLGAYGVVGGGFYHKVTNFTLPTTGEQEDAFGDIFTFTQNQNFDTYTSNAPGVNGGIGVTYKLSRFANQRIFAEARYVHTFNSARLGDPTVTGSTGTNFNFYPPNSNETSYIPITFGVRF